MDRVKTKDRSCTELTIDFVRDYCKFGPERVYLLTAIARMKDNPLSSSEEIVFQEVVGNKDDVQKKYSKLRAVAAGYAENGETYNFRLYLSVNARNTTKAYFNFRSRMNERIRERLNGADSRGEFKGVDRRWLSELSKPSSKDETRFLIDVDEDDQLSVDEVRDVLVDETTILAECRTPNGWHIVTSPFNYNDLPVKLEIKTDALLFLEHICKSR
ncbi:hypothetical protein AKJ38_03075 [candidate division MSBL1 archaeon SCGC-AAA259I14]|uniref:Uncharacterized protein n=1 Tax=candidate division MSBL1 archaeon SCGC-AAA259I14 TaxID=1698268 RepID=A0A133UQP1_9EURY|nr:hypothetical protein AKJ38_03075 [candidate division MSBL1 archaeon SCGC-AAA259I14]